MHQVTGYVVKQKFCQKTHLHIKIKKIATYCLVNTRLVNKIVNIKLSTPTNTRYMEHSKIFDVKIIIKNT